MKRTKGYSPQSPYESDLSPKDKNLRELRKLSINVFIVTLLVVVILSVIGTYKDKAEVLIVIIREDTSSATILYDNGKYETMHIKHTDDAYRVEKMCVVTTLYSYGDKSITVEKSKIVYLAGIQPQG